MSKFRKTALTKLDDFAKDTVDALFALASIAVDVLFWIGWAYLTNFLSAKVASLSLSDGDRWPFVIAQWCASAVIFWFSFLRSLRDGISMFDSFVAFYNARKTAKRGW